MVEKIYRIAYLYKDHSWYSENGEAYGQTEAECDELIKSRLIVPRPGHPFAIHATILCSDKRVS